MGSVNITLTNGALGSTLQTNDGVAGMVITGVSVTGGLEVNTPTLLTGRSSLATLGITLDNNGFIYNQVQDFYSEAGDSAELYLMMTDAEQKITAMCDLANEDGVTKLLDYAKGRIKLLGVMSNDAAVAFATGDTIDTTHGINGDVYTAVAKLQQTVAAYRTRHQPLRAIIGGTTCTGDAGALNDVSTGATNNSVSILVGDTNESQCACLGLLLGRLSTIPVMRKVSRVRTGPLNTSEAWIGSLRVDTAPGSAAVVASKGFITWCAYPNVAGFFFSGDDTCSSRTDDYHFLCRGRVIDKAHVIAYTTFVQEVDDEVPVNNDGTLDAGFCKWLSQQIVNQVNNSMTINKEISSVSCFIDPAQNILSTNRLNVVLRIVPVGYATDIEISLGFENPAL